MKGRITHDISPNSAPGLPGSPAAAGGDPVAAQPHLLPYCQNKAPFAAAAGLLAALLVVLWMFRGDFPGDVPVAMLYLTVLALIQAWFLGADGAAQS